ncbi:MAG: glutamine--tRNA ligase, partial [Syntrophomonadaceae bacterium]|nr:glutamine--tRNA ligase [Syntrophomonadaceae bacterium]
GGPTAGRKIKGTSHWVSALHAIPAEVRLYDHLFLQEDPEEDEAEDFTSNINPRSLERLTSCMLEPGLADAAIGNRYQFMRQGYFCIDPDSTPDKLVFNRIVSLRDTWAKMQKK